ncbi:MAG TPA: ABC transporter permease subunit [Ktedonobacterales bacterium]|jgi:ABC-type transport system involved in multi-copper enzyme maturation permease subunit|nr:ABC transporter permease subunit [Ktedonobacterales bacterium]
MIVKELRTARWSLLVGLAILGVITAQLAATDLHTVDLQAITDQTDAALTVVTSGRLSVGAAFLWAGYFSTTLYFLVGLGGAVFGAGLVASETSSGTALLVLSRPMSRERVLLTKYGVAALSLLLLSGLCGGLALLFGAQGGVRQPPLGGVLLSVVLLWLGELFVMGVTLVYSVLVPSAVAAGILGFFTAYALAIVPLFHNASTNHYYLGGPDWSVATYWSSLDIYAGGGDPVKALVAGLGTALFPLAVAVLLFRRKAF